MTDIYTLALAIVREHERQRLEKQQMESRVAAEFDYLLEAEAADEARAEHSREVEYCRDHPGEGYYV